MRKWTLNSVWPLKSFQEVVGIHTYSYMGGTPVQPRVEGLVVASGLEGPWFDPTWS